MYFSPTDCVFCTKQAKRNSHWSHQNMGNPVRFGIVRDPPGKNLEDGLAEVSN